MWVLKVGFAWSQIQIVLLSLNGTVAVVFVQHLHRFHCLTSLMTWSGKSPWDRSSSVVTLIRGSGSTILLKEYNLLVLRYNKTLPTGSTVTRRSTNMGPCHIPAPSLYWDWVFKHHSVLLSWSTFVGNFFRFWQKFSIALIIAAFKTDIKDLETRHSQWRKNMKIRIMTCIPLP